jgi:hypothetical protein
MKHQTGRRKAQGSSIYDWCLLHAGFMFGLNPENGSNIFIKKIG